MMRFLPQSLPAWVLILVVVAFATTQVITLTAASIFAVQSNRTVDLFRLAEKTTDVMRAVVSVPAASRSEVINNLRNASLAVSLDTKPAASTVIAADDELAELEDILTAKLSTLGASDLRIAEYPAEPSHASSTFANPDPKEAGPVELNLSRISSAFANTGEFVVSVQMADHTWLNLFSPISPAPALFTRENVYWYILLSACTIFLCVWAVVQLTAPYRRLESAVHRIGEYLGSPPIPEKGGSEVRAVIRAINTMQRRLQDHVAEREYLAAALAHDLRTPLTRMKLRCELPAKGRDWKSLALDVRELESIVQSMLDFASLGSRADPKERVELVSLAQAVCDQFPQAECSCECASHPPIIVEGHPTSIRRCLTNLVDNAIRYGGSAAVSIETAGEFVQVRIDDEGPGIPESELENVLKPFYRLDRSRSRETGGSGLGFAIAERVARALGGTLKLANRPGRGLAAILSLPVFDPRP